MDPIADFAAAYLHEDWQETHPDFSDVLATFIDEASRAKQTALGLALVQLLDETRTEAETESRLREHGWQVFFDDVPTRTVIRQVSEALLAL